VVLHLTQYVKKETRMWWLRRSVLFCEPLQHMIFTMWHITNSIRNISNTDIVECFCCSFLFGLCNDPSNIPDYIMPNSGTINDDNNELKRMWKEAPVTILEAQTRDLPGRTEEYMKAITYDRRCPSQDFWSCWALRRVGNIKCYHVPYELLPPSSGLHVILITFFATL
jgi:hypothetical protein